MTSATFDTHKLDEKQAEGLTDAMRSAIEASELVIKKAIQIELATDAGICGCIPEAHGKTQAMYVLTQKGERVEICNDGAFSRRSGEKS